MINLPQYNPILHQIETSLSKEKKLSWKILRLDLIDEIIGGNKLFKLKYNLEEAAKTGLPVLTFGGAFSNHIIATAKACSLNKISSLGIIRGEKPTELNHVLKEAEEFGMKLHFVSREEYRRRGDAEYQYELQNKFGNHFIIPEGGGNELGVKGCMEIPKAIEEEFDFIFTPVGSGGTLAGLALSAPVKTKVIGIAILKGENYLEQSVKDLIGRKHVSQWSINHHYRFGGYAKRNNVLIEFINKFKSVHDILLEPIYSGKLFFAVDDLIKNNYFSAESRILCLHTG
ncbi:MAG: pyridoxal-phosphate dependent enzyme, partial [Sphingobacteriales bacterium]